MAAADSKEITMEDAGEPSGPNSNGVSTHVHDPSHLQNDYDRRKQGLLSRENQVAWDSNARQEASLVERTAAEIIWKIREDERDNLYGNKASEAIPGPETLDMGGQFLTNKERTEKFSRLFQIALNLPKGGHLHLHFNAELAPDMLIEKARYNPHIFIRSTRPLLTEEDFASAELVFNVLPFRTVEADLFSLMYNPEFKSPEATPWMRWRTFQNAFEEQGRGDAEAWIKTKMILCENEVYGLSQTTNG
jgi:adenosine deaminase CECR1